MSVRFGDVICDPGPCDPGPLDVVLSDFGFGVVIIFAITAFVAGRKTFRADIVLPTLCMATIAVSAYLNYAQELDFMRRALFDADGLTPTDVMILELARQEKMESYSVGYLAFAVIPFGFGVLTRVFQQRHQRRAHA